MANPVLKAMEKTYVLEGEPMTINGTINKSFILFAMLVAAACYTWWLVAGGFTDKASLLMTGGAIVGFILAMVIIFTKKAMNVLTPIYAACEGLALGGISAVYAGIYKDIVIQAIALTFAALFAMLFLYRTNLIKCTDTFRKVIFTATLAIAIVYLIEIIASFFGMGIPLIFGSGPVGIGFSLLVCGIASLNLILDFDFIERGSEHMLPKEFEWYGAFGLMVTLVWLYLEILKLLAKSRSNK